MFRPEDLTEAHFNILFEQGFVHKWYLRKSQKELYKLLRNKKRVVANCHRRFGKGTTVLVYVFERMLTENILVRYGAPTQKQAFEILEILIDHIFKYAPSLKPKYTNGAYRFPSGSSMHVFGVKDASELDKGRGPEADIIVADEYGFWRYKPSYALKSVLSPQLDNTDGQLIITSTPPEDMTHPFITEEIPQAQLGEYLFNWELQKSLDIGDVSYERHIRIIERCGGKETDAYRREYELDLIANRSRLVLPEAQDESLYTYEYNIPDFHDEYVCFDLGFKDFTFGLFGYYDFKTARLVVRDELCLNYKATSEIVAEARRIEEELCIFKPSRFGDCSDLQQLYDFSSDYGYAITPITKRSKMNSQGFRESVLNGLRVAVGSNRIIIDERCKQLRTQIKYGIWNEKRTDFERTEAMGHLDGLMALAYLWDNIDFGSNPFPAVPPSVVEATHHINPEFFDEQPKKSFGKLIGR